MNAPEAPAQSPRRRRKFLRSGVLIPLFGLSLLVGAFATRAFRGEGLSLAALPVPVQEEIALPEAGPGTAHLRGILRDEAGRALPEALVMVAGEGRIVFEGQLREL